MVTLEQLVDLARQVELTDPIDWADLNISEDNAYHLIAAGILEYYESLTTTEEKINMLLASVVKLSVENFVLNIKLLRRRD